MAILTTPGEESEDRPLPRGIAVRRGTVEDEFATFEVMRRAMGYETNWANDAPTRAHLRTTQHASYWLAEETSRFGATKIVGYARSIVREGVWRLTEFFVLPGYHRKGIGGALLARSLEDGERAGAHTHFVLASHHPGADSLYVRMAGCFPRLPMLLLAGPLNRLLLPDAPPLRDALSPHAYRVGEGMGGRATPPAGTLSAEPLLLTPGVQAALDTLDRETVGYARPLEHAHWTTLAGSAPNAARLFRRVTGNSSEIVGYAYLGSNFSGPALALDPGDLPRMIAHVAGLAQRQNRPNFEFATPSDQYLAIAGTNEAMLSWLLACGWQIVYQYLLMSSRPLGRLDRYVCRNPLYFL